MAVVGQAAPDFTLPTFDGSEYGLRNLQGKGVLLVFLRYLG